ncbi:MAG: hypothetical protein IKN38_10925 [Clostridia bacterium]|nr:hypothetical protein [Clostridia bacterium]
MKRFTSLLTALVMLFGAMLMTSCGADSGDGTPKGMKLASSDAASYRFYVPDTWQCDVASDFNVVFSLIFLIPLFYF